MKINMKYSLRASVALILLSSLMPTMAYSVDCKSMSHSDNRNVLACHIDYTFDDDGDMLADTMYFIRSIRVMTTLQIVISLDQLSIVLNQNGIQIPQQNLYLAFNLSTGEVLPVTITLSPYLKVKPDTQSVCILNFADIDLRVTKIESPNLPTWLEESLSELLNKNALLKSEVTSQANKLIAKGLKTICG